MEKRRTGIERFAHPKLPISSQALLASETVESHVICDKETLDEFSDSFFFFSHFLQELAYGLHKSCR